MSQLTGAVISLTGQLIDLTMTSMKNQLLQTQLNQTIIALSPTSIFQSLSLLPYTGLLGTLAAHHLLLNFPVIQSFHLLKMQASSVTLCELQCISMLPLLCEKSLLTSPLHDLSQ